jgi:IMP dehydrogenase
MQGVCYTYDDVIFHPGHIFFGAHEVDMSTNVSKKIKLHTPIVSSPMDTVTEAEMAITMAMVSTHMGLHSPAKYLETLPGCSSLIYSGNQG